MSALIYPNWPAPPQVRAVATTRLPPDDAAPVSSGVYAGFNLADHVGEPLACVKQNRQRLQSVLQLKQSPCWLQQVHGADIVNADVAVAGVRADAAYVCVPHAVCVVQTADCLPVLFCNAQGTQVAAAHAGWRGLAAGVLPATCASFAQPMQELLAWLGPAIGPQAYEVGEDVYNAITGQQESYAEAFHDSRKGHWYLDLYCLARLQLRQLGLRAIYGGDWCTYQDTRFYSYRRDGQCGRMASLIWLHV